MKAIILARVSTEEQKEAGNSLPAQQARLRGYIDRVPRLELDKEFIFDESAYKEHRKEFEKVIDYTSGFKEVVALCCDKVDRLTRDFLVGLPDLERLRRDGKIELHFPSDNLVLHRDSPATDLFHFNIAVSLAQYYSNAISDNTKRAFETKRRNGEWTGKGPIGYINVINEQGKKDIVPDPKTAHLVKKMFELYATGNHSTKTLRPEIAKLGLQSSVGKPLSLSMVSFILTNPFYHGEMKSGGKLYPHKYQPLISKQLFDKCEEVRTSWKKKPFKYAAKPFALRGLIRCSRCGCAMSPEIKKGQFIYYSCTNYRKNCTRVYVPEKALLEPIYDVLHSFERLPQETIDRVLVGLKKTTEAKSIYHKKAILGLQKEYNDIQTKTDRLIDLLASGSITTDIYDKKLKEWKDRQYELNLLLEDHTKADESYHITAAMVFSVAKRAMKIIEKSEPNEKRVFFNYLLQNAVVDGKKLTFELRTPYNHILSLIQTSEPAKSASLKRQNALSGASFDTNLRGHNIIITVLSDKSYMQNLYNQWNLIQGLQKS